MNLGKISRLTACVLCVSCMLAGCNTTAPTTTNTTKVDTSTTNASGKIHLVASSFAAYDFVRAITKDTDKISYTFLDGPGKDPHSFVPTAKQMIDIQQADVFVYNGGGMEGWTAKVLPDIDTSHTKLLKLIDTVQTQTEKEVQGAEPDNDENSNEPSIDEHAWTSPTNAIKMVDSLATFLGELDPTNAATYKTNAEAYESQISDIRTKIQDIVDHSKRKTVVFGDKMPFQYFLDEFGLTAYAAFSGCSTETEPSAATIAGLVTTVKEKQLPVVLYIEMGNAKVATAIADETGTKAEQIQTIHNVTADDFNKGETYVSLLNKDLSVLKDALQ